MKKMQGVRYVNLLRCSTHEQADTSIEDQRRSNNAFAKAHGMVHVFDEVADGVSASKPIGRSDIDGLIAKKVAGADFEVVLVHDLSRLTRGGSEHGYNITQRFAEVGVAVVSASDNLPEGDLRAIMASMLHWKDSQFSKGLSRAVSRGLYSSLMNKKRPHSAVTPWGYDRLYIQADGTPTVRARPIGNGRTQLINPSSGEIIRTLTDGQSYKKQEDEWSVLVPGADERVLMMRRIFKEHYIDLVGAQSVTVLLNASGLLPARSGTWSKRTVQRMLRNPTYLGLPTSFRQHSGWFHKMAQDRPAEVEVNFAALMKEGRACVPPSKRPPNEWHTPSEPDAEIAIIIDPDVWAAAKSKMDEYWMDWATDAAAEHANRDRHTGSSYWLKGILRSIQGDHPMGGRTTGAPRKWRYYLIHRGADFPKGSVLRNLIPAAEVEEVVANLMQETLSQTGEIAKLLEEQLLEQCAPADDDELRRLKKKEASLVRSRKVLYEVEAGQFDDDELRERALSLKDQLREVRVRMASLEGQNGISEEDVEAIRDSVVGQLHHFSDHVADLTPSRLSSLAKALCRSVRVDLETRDLFVELRLPGSAIADPAALGGHEDMCLQAPSSHQKRLQAHNVADLLLGQFECTYSRINHKAPICYDCRRITAAERKLRLAEMEPDQDHDSEPNSTPHHPDADDPSPESAA